MLTYTYVIIFTCVGLCNGLYIGCFCSDIDEYYNQSLIIQRCVVHAINEITKVIAMYTRAVVYIFQCHNLK